jgi:hypothetical protein
LVRKGGVKGPWLPGAREQRRSARRCPPKSNQEISMDKSIYEARWVLAPIFGIYLGLIAFGVLVA